MESARSGRVVFGTGEERELARLGRRLGARIIDIIIVGIVEASIVGFFWISVGGIVWSSLLDDDDVLFVIVALGFGAILLFLLVALLYEVAMIALRGQTLGKMVTCVRVVRVDNGGIPGWGKSVGRWLILTLPAGIPTVGWLAVLLVYASPTWDKRRQGWHDKVVSTVVVRA